MTAALRGHTKSVELLVTRLHNGAECFSLLASTSDVLTEALKLAAEHGHSDVLSFLLSLAHNGMPLEEDASGAMSCDGTPPRLLIDVNATHVYSLGRTSLHMASGSGSDAVVGILLQFPHIDVNVGACFGDTALHFAADSGSSHIVRMLLGMPGIEVDAVDFFGRTPLHNAANRGDVESVRALCEALRARGKPILVAGTTTPLHLAASVGHTRVVEAMLGMPTVDARVKDRRGRTFVEVAENDDKRAELKMLFKPNRRNRIKAAVRRLLRRILMR